MASRALFMLGFLALLLVVSEVTATSERHSVAVKTRSEDTFHPDQFTYEGDPGHGIPEEGGSNRATPGSLLLSSLLSICVWALYLDRVE